MVRDVPNTDREPRRRIMIRVRDLFETHLMVADVDRAIGFYRDVIGLRLAHVTPARHAAFFLSLIHI